MKKSIIALAVAAASMTGIAQADGTTLYGSMRVHYTYEDTNLDASNALDLDGVSTVGNNSSRIGIKGSNDMGNGLSAVYKFEWKVNLSANSAFSQRDAYIGIAGDFGTVLAGTITVPYDDVAGATDNTNAVAGGFLRNYEDTFFSPGRVDNVLAYVTPDMGGFSASAGVVMNGESGEEHVDAYQVTAGYDANGLSAAIGYAAAEATTGDLDSVAIALGYSNDTFGVNATVERYNNDAVDRNPLAWTLYGEYNVSDADKIYANYGQYDYDNSIDNAQGAALGYQHMFNKRTRIWAEYGFQDSGVDGADTANTVSIGVRTDF